MFFKFLSKTLYLWCLFLIGICSRCSFNLLSRKHLCSNYRKSVFLSFWWKTFPVILLKCILVQLT